MSFQRPGDIRTDSVKAFELSREVRWLLVTKLIGDFFNWHSLYDQHNGMLLPQFIEPPLRRLAGPE
jgi:hypothetical protein